MIVVADSGPLHYLILLEQVDLLRRFYGQVLVPQAVASELSTAGAPGVVREWITRQGHEITTFLGDQIAQAIDRLAGYEIIGAVDVRALLRTLNIDPGERRLAELGPPQKT